MVVLLQLKLMVLVVMLLLLLLLLLARKSLVEAEDGRVLRGGRGSQVHSHEVAVKGLTGVGNESVRHVHLRQAVSTE